MLHFFTNRNTLVRNKNTSEGESEVFRKRAAYLLRIFLSPFTVMAVSHQLC
ncbi:hypothetical protein XBO1_2110117 [Xenorhabdus bovienii str. oregonense]|uniref:Uncharacterized protein n=1 Tax=Xenorhabdus bovienii str. oregonense TaxID=1398202 RepID=A0A077P5N6_XENBV|nr:hypothetical protein XBO1_2110117 [Xenorhabdus bovienii str. oregonense]